MFKKLEKNLSTLSVRYLFIIALFLGFSIVIDILYLIYDVVLLGLWLGNEIVISEFIFSLIFMLLSVYCIFFLKKIRGLS